MAATSWEPGDDICPPWPWWWHGPRPPWLNDAVLDLGREVFVGLTLINTASKMKDAKAGLQIAKTGAKMVAQQAAQLNTALGKSR